MPNQDYVVEEPEIDETLPEEPIVNNEYEKEEKQSLGDRYQNAREKYGQAKELRDRFGKKQPAPEAKTGAGQQTPGEIKGKIGRPTGVPKAPPAGGGVVGGAGEAGEAVAGGAKVAGGAARIAGTAGETGGAVAAGGTLWWVVLIIIVVLIIVAFILFTVGFVVGLASGGRTSSGSSFAPQYAGQYAAPYISTDGKYFPLTIKPQNNFTPGSSRGFGDSRDGGSRRHAGVDLIAPVGTPIRSIADGTVVNSYYFYSGTYCLIVDYGDFVINYGEIGGAAPGVSIGSQVKAGQIIAYVGRLGSGSSMLHMEMYTAGTKQNSAWRGSKPSNLLDPTSFVTELLGGFK